MINKPEAPCGFCDKSGLLHERCEKYKQYKEQMAIFRAQEKLEADIRNTVNEGRIRMMKSTRSGFKQRQI